MATPAWWRRILWAVGLCLCWLPAGQTPEKAPAGQPVLKKDSYGDPLPANALARLGTVRYQNTLYANAFAVSADDQWLACRARDSIHLLEVRTGRWLKSFKVEFGLGITEVV